MKNKKTKTTKTLAQTKQQKLCQSAKTTETAPNNLCDCTTLYLDEDTKVRRMSLQLYADPSQWGAVLLEAEHYAYIYHDKDINEDGTPKTPHYHLLLIFKNARYRNGVRKLFEIPIEGENSTVNFQKLANPKRAFQYLMHKTADARKANKYIYELGEVTCDDLSFWEDYCDNVENQEFLTDLQNLDARAMALRYGRDYIKNYKRYDDFAYMLKTERERQICLENLTIAEAIINSADGFDERVQTAIAEFLVRVIRHNTAFKDEATIDGFKVSFTIRDTVNAMLAKIEEITYNALLKEGV